MRPTETAGEPRPGPTLVDGVLTIVLAIAPLVGVLIALVDGVVRGNVARVHVVLFVVSWALTLFAVEAGYHRYFSHRAFRASRPLQAFFVIFGSMAFEGPAIWWAATHRRHHRHADQPGDPHSPHLAGPGVTGMLRGLWDAHFGWNLGAIASMRDRDGWKPLVPDLLRDPWLRRLNRGYFLWMALGLALPFAIGALGTGTLRGGAIGLVWGGLARIFFVNHGIYAVNSLGHAFGRRPFALFAQDRATNHWALALVTFGAGLHHNHHVFPNAATTRIAWWEIDLSGLVLAALARVGLASELRWPPDARGAGFTRVVTARLDLPGHRDPAPCTLGSLTRRGAFLELAGRDVPRGAIGARLRLSGVTASDIAAADLAALAPAEIEVEIESLSWQGLKVVFTTPSPALGAFVDRLRQRGASPATTTSRSSAPPASEAPAALDPSEPHLDPIHAGD